jgi:hypothetical protein
MERELLIQHFNLLLNIDIVSVPIESMQPILDNFVNKLQLYLVNKYDQYLDLKLSDSDSDSLHISDISSEMDENISPGKDNILIYSSLSLFHPDNIDAKYQDDAPSIKKMAK